MSSPLDKAFSNFKKNPSDETMRELNKETLAFLKEHDSCALPPRIMRNDDRPNQLSVEQIENAYPKETAIFAFVLSARFNINFNDDKFLIFAKQWNERGITPAILAMVPKPSDSYVPSSLMIKDTKYIVHMVEYSLPNPKDFKVVF